MTWALLLALLLLAPASVSAQGVGLFQTAPTGPRQTCASITSPVVGQTFCLDQATNSLKRWDGANWIQIDLTGVNATDYASFAAAITAIGSATQTLVITNAQTVASNLTVPANVALLFSGAGQLSIATGVTVTIVGPVLASQTQIFTTSGTGKVVFNGATGLTVGSLLYSFPAVWWGAKFNQAESTGSITTGQATLVNTGGVLFTAADIGKTIVVKGAGAAGANLITTIAGFTDTTHVTLTATAGTTVTSAGMNWATDDAAAIQAALNAVPVSATVQFPAGTAMVKTGLTTLGGINIIGTGQGYEHSRLNYVATTGALLAIQNNGYFNTHLADFSMENSGGIATPVGLDITWTRVHIDRLVVLPFSATATGFAVGIRFNQIGACGKTFDNTIRDSYIGQNAIGIDLRATDDTTIDHTYLENNLTNIRIGADCASSQVVIVNSASVLNGAIMGAGGIGVDVQQTTSLVIRDTRFETDLGQSATYHASVAVSMGTVSANTSTVISGNFFNGDGVADRLIYVQGAAVNTSNLTIRDNYFYRTTVAVEFVNSNTSVDIGPNTFTNSTTYLKIAGVNDANTKYVRWMADTSNPVRIDSILTMGSSQASGASTGDIVTKYGQGLRSVNSGNTTSYQTIRRATVNANEVVQIAGSGDATAFGTPTSFGSGGNAGDIFLQGKLRRHGDAAPADGQVLIGGTAAGNFTAGTLAAGPGIAVTNGNNTVTVGGASSPGVLQSVIALTNSSAYSAIASTNTETLFGIAADGKIPAGAINAAKHRIEATFRGIYGVNGATDTITLKAKLCTVSGCGSGTVIQVGATGAVLPGVAVTNQGWETKVDCNVFTSGASGTLDCQGFSVFSLTGLTALQADDMVNTTTVTVDTTVDEYLSLSATWNNSSPNNTIQLRNLGVKVY